MDSTSWKWGFCPIGSSWNCMQGRPPKRLQKVCGFQVPKMNPLDMARCCSESNRKISKCGYTSPVHCQISKRANVQLFHRRKQNLYSYSHFRKLHGCTLIFLYVFWEAKEEKLTTLLFHQKWFASDLIRQNFSNMGMFPRTPSTQWFRKDNHS